MDESDRSVWFVGDLDDPWVEAIADALPSTTIRHHAGGELPDSLMEFGQPPSTLVIHRAVLTRRDAERLKLIRARQSMRVVLCFGPHVRYAAFERWSDLVDVVLSRSHGQRDDRHDESSLLARVCESSRRFDHAPGSRW